MHVPGLIPVAIYGSHLAWIETLQMKCACIARRLLVIASVHAYCYPLLAEQQLVDRSSWYTTIPSCAIVIDR